jgi:hypothetical protein
MIDKFANKDLQKYEKTMSADGTLTQYLRRKQN